MQNTYGILGDVSPNEFLTHYWQRKPLLVRNAWPNFISPVTADELAGLSLEDEVESRLISGPDWQVESGPFDEKRFSELAPSDWTLLVQAVDLWLPDVAQIMDQFNFLPRWRMDDIMISYAVDGGGVGPHYDEYDVFLLQGAGQRRWEVGESCDEHTPLRSHSQLKIIKDFNASQEWLLNPGDMLYVPPRWSHHGIAVGDCMTYSVGFRSPSASDMLDDLATEVLSRGTMQQALRDPPLLPCNDSLHIPKSYVEQVRALLLTVLDDERLLGEWFAQYMTQPKYPHLVDLTSERRCANIDLPVANTANLNNRERVHFYNGDVDASRT